MKPIEKENITHMQKTRQKGPPPVVRKIKANISATNKRINMYETVSLIFIH